MIERKAAITAFILILATSVASLWSIVHVHVGWLIVGHILVPCLGVAMWLLMRRDVRRYPNAHNLEGALKKHYGFMLVSCCAVLALIEAVFVAHDFGVQDPLYHGRLLPVALLGVIFVVLGNARGKLPSPYKGGHAEPISWDTMNRFVGWVFVICGFGMSFGSLILPAWVLLPYLVVSWLIGMSLLVAKRQQLLIGRLK